MKFRVDFAGKPEDRRRGVFPGTERQAGLPTGLVQKLFTAQAMLSGHLGEQESTSLSADDEQSMRSNLNFIGSQRNERREYRDLNLQITEFVRAKRSKPWIVHRRAHRRLHDVLSQRSVPLDHADAAAQLLLNEQCDKNAPVPGENSRIRNMIGDTLMDHSFRDGEPR